MSDLQEILNNFRKQSSSERDKSSIDSFISTSGISFGKLKCKRLIFKTREYVVNGKSAIEWIMERYQVTINKDSQIKNNPNDWATEHNDPTYILNLLLSIITLSLESRSIISSLPSIKEEIGM